MALNDGPNTGVRIQMIVTDKDGDRTEFDGVGTLQPFNTHRKVDASMELEPVRWVSATIYEFFDEASKRWAKGETNDLPGA